MSAELSVRHVLDQEIEEAEALEETETLLELGPVERLDTSNHIDAKVERQDRLLLEEYRANVATMNAENLHRQQRHHTYLFANTILFGAATLLIAQRPDPPAWPFVVKLLLLGMSAAGLCLALTWILLIHRLDAYWRVRRLQLQSIEAHLPYFTTFKRIDRALYERKETRFSGLPADSCHTFKPGQFDRMSSSMLESVLPGVIFVGWAVLAILLLRLLLGW